MVGQTISHYKITERLGEGGMGVVYKAEDTKLRRTVALKFPSINRLASEEEKARFVREAQAVATLNHPNICTIYEIDEADGHTFIAMEFVEGQSIKEKLRARPLPLEEALDIATQAAQGLQVAHDAGVVHRDIKSANLMVTGKGQVKVMDFGLAQVGDRSQLTKTGTTLGTAAYMSPEQALANPTDHRTDNWSLGVVLYEMITGQLPFQGEVEAAVAYGVVNTEPEPPTARRSGLPIELDEILDKALAKDREERYQHLEDLVVDLQALQRSLHGDNRLSAGLFGTGETRAVSRRRRRARKKTSAIAAAVLAALAVLLIALGLYWLRIPDPLPSEIRLAILPLALEGPNAPTREYADGLIATVSERVAALDGRPPGLAVLPPREALHLQAIEPAEAALRLGANLVLSGNLVSSEETLRATLDLFSPDRGRVVRRDTFEIARGDPVALREQLVTVLSEMLDIPPSSTAPQLNQQKSATAYGHYVEGRGYLLDESRLESIEKAISLFHRAQAEDEEYGLAWAGLGRAYLRKWELTKEESAFQLAKSAADTAIAFASDIPQAHIAVGHVHLGSGRSEEAAANFGRALELDPGNLDAIIGMGRAYEANQALQEAEFTLKKAVAMRPKLWTGYKWLGVFYYNRGRYREAIDQYKKILELAPRSVHARINLGIFHAYLDELDEAGRFWEEAVEIEPRASVLGNLGKLAFDQGDYPEAVRRYEQAAELRPNLHLISLLSKLDSGYGNLDSMQAESPQSVPGVGRQKPLKQAFWGNRSLTEGGLRRAA